MVAMYPGLVKAMEKMKAESERSTWRHVGGRHPHHHRWKSARQMAEAEKQDAQPTGLGGLLAKKLMKQGNRAIRAPRS